MVNEYDSLAGKLFEGKEEAPVGGEYEQIAAQTIDPSPQKFQSSQFVAKKKNPEVVTEAMKIAREVDMPVDFVERNLESFKEKRPTDDMSYEAIVDRSPRLAKWLEDPYKASMASDDLEALSKVERNANRIRPYTDKPGYVSDLGGAVATGYNNLENSGMLLAAAYGVTDIQTVANEIADRNKRIQARQQNLPLYAKEFQSIMEREGKDIDQSFEKFKSSFGKFKDKKILEGLADFGSGGAMTVAETLDLVYEAAKQPRGVIRSSLESLAFSAPSLATGFAGAKGGAAAGTLVAPGIGTAIGGAAGFAAGQFGGAAAPEVGAWINQSLSERGYDTTNPDDLVRAFRNKKLMAEVRGEAERKGVTTAGVDALFSVVAGKFLKGAKGAGKVAKAKAVAKDVGVQMIGEGGSEFAGQAAARKGDLSKVSIGEAVFEGVVSMGHSVGETVIGAGYRATLSKKTTVAAEEVVEQVARAQETIDEVQALEQLGQIAQESNLQTKDPEVFGEFFAEANVDGGADQAVYFQKEQWDEFWQAKGESPIAKAEELLGSSEAYDEADLSGQPMAIPMKDYIAKMGDKPEFGELIESIKTKPDGMTVAEATEVLKETPATLEALAEEAKAEKEMQDQVEVAGQEIKKRLELQLKEAGRDPVEALPLAAFYQTMGVKEGINPLELADKYGLQIKKLDETQAQGGETVFDQAQLETPEFKKFFDGSKVVDSDGNPLVVYHGTDKDFNTFKSNDGEFFFTDETKLSDEFGSKRVEAYVNLKNPHIVDMNGRSGKDVFDEIDFAKQNGFDGVIASNVFEGEGIPLHQQIVAFKPEQIKSATSNEGSFDPQDPNIFKQDQRGRIRISGNDKFTIELLKNADKSTFFHESGHYFLEVLKDMQSMDSASQELKDDFKSILDWMGVESADQIETEHHEKWARGFEAYLREGKAPSSKLRKAFNTFKVWLTSVYRSALQLDVQLSPEIRGVMDRMLATQEEIDQAQQSMNDLPLFVDPIEAGMNEKQADTYKQAVAEANMSAKEMLEAKAQRVVDKRKKIQAGINRERIEAATKEEPLYKAIESLKSSESVDGAPPLKFDRAHFKQTHPELYGSPKFKGMFSDDGSGMSPEMVSAILGFDDLVGEISQAPDLKAVVEAEVQRLTDEQFALEESPEALAEAADIALHNESRAKRLRMEYEHLSRGTQNEATRRIAKRPAPDSEIKGIAAKIINNMAVGTIRPNQYRLAERRYAKEAGKLLAAKDIEGAFLAKQRELLNYYLYREAQNAKQQIKRGEKSSKRFFEKDEKLSKSRDMDFIGAARAVLARYGLGNSKKDALAQIAKIKEYNPDAYETVSSIIVGLVDDPDIYTNIEYGKFKDLMDGVQSLWDLSKDIKEVEVGGKKISIKKANQELIAEMQKFKKPRAEKKYNETITDLEKMKTELLGVKAMVRRFESWVDVMDLGDISGPFRKYLFSGVSDATSEFIEQNKNYKKKFTELSQPIADSFDPSQAIEADEIGFKFKNKGELLGALLHTGNIGNKKKLLVGRNWGMLDEDGNLVSAKWDKFIDRMHQEGTLTKADYDYVQSLWDLMEEIKPMAQKSHKKVFGFYFDEVTAAEFETPFGKYRGGYAPAKVDPNVVTDIARKQELEEFVKGHQSYTYPASGGRGFTKSRVENFNKPLNIDVSLVGKHLEDVLRFAIVKPAVIDAAKIVTSQEFKTAMGEVDSAVIEKMIKPALNRADKNTIQTTDPAGSPLVRRVGNVLKSSASMQLMFANVVNTAEQFGGLGISATRISPRYLARSGYRYMMSPRETSRATSEKSQAMRVRFDDQIFEMEKRAQKIFSEETKYQKMKNFAQQHTYFLQSFTQNIVDNITWQASYDESIAKGKTDRQAVRKADADVRITQSSRRPMDISNLETNATLGFFQMFMNFFNMMANVNASNFAKLYYEDIGMKQKFAKGMYLYATGFATVAIVSSALRKAAAGGLDEDEDNEYLDDLFDVFIGSQKDLALAMIPVAGPAINAGLNQANDKFYDDRMSASPAVSALTAVVGTTTKAFSGKLTDGKNTKGDIRDGLTALGILTGLPLYPLSKPINYVNDVESGKARPSGPLDAIRGVVTGKPGIR